MYCSGGGDDIRRFSGQKAFLDSDIVFISGMLSAEWCPSVSGAVLQTKRSMVCGFQQYIRIISDGGGAYQEKQKKAERKDLFRGSAPWGRQDICGGIV